ncbi:hypothetical protein TVAG_383370 [Trichomonas vaginalis G3]|uniref:Uncharacterized protein n=1 Tax=Trichomonas vaginalis (strain ATCC PRA-98 / G3) TaxID=412133 RepID=A2FSG7_TRIV3|nr:hypothetical protein TVAGG3_0006600 [Trichomonas vaginalis G3]EAX92164.1 hypothetical protein TVAG_383370 [Trichomonas vaginalis G3]KAI5538942.1 hypothetical protein TVAGG3_0006600 [Trichomonas vaginalis G3]|eukprot:XP_001305094.1 hypothetical protein [Trichomonas vaginalis G3]
MALSTNDQLVKFREITDLVTKKQIDLEEGERRIKEIDFQKFNIDEMDEVQQCTWFSDGVYVDIMRRWVRQQDDLLLQLRAFLVVTPEIAKETLTEFVKAVKNPSQVPNISVSNVIHSLSTAGGTRAAINPITEGLIGAKCSVAASIGYKLDDIYTENDKYFKSQPVASVAVTITLPQFLKIQMEKYTLTSPHDCKGLRAWSIDVTNDPKEQNWTNIDTKDLELSENPFVESNKTHEFTVNKQESGFFRTIKISLLRETLNGNLSMVLKKFDFTGKLIIAKD